MERVGVVITVMRRYGPYGSVGTSRVPFPFEYFLSMIDLLYINIDILLILVYYRSVYPYIFHKIILYISLYINR